MGKKEKNNVSGRAACYAFSVITMEGKKQKVLSSL
jgi:hypothetical protein